MKKKIPKSYSKFTLQDLKELGVEVVLTDLFDNEVIAPIKASEFLKESLEGANHVSLDTEKARSEYLIAPVLRELQKNNMKIFSVYSGFNFNVDPQKGLQGFCDYLLARLPLTLVPDSPILVVVEAKLSGSLGAAVPQCGAEMYATRLWNEKKGEHSQPIYGIVTTGDYWLFLRLKENLTIEVDKSNYPLKQLEELLGVLQHIINKLSHT